MFFLERTSGAIRIARVYHASTTVRHTSYAVRRIGFGYSLTVSGPYVAAR